MKKILFLIIFTPALSIAQDFNFLGLGDCGHWETSSVQMTDWQLEDTIPFNSWGDTTWIESEWRYINTNIIHPVYRPCKLDIEKYQERISGRRIRQIRYEITSYKYIPKPETEYQKKLREIRGK